jgi:hypothetical protein
MDNWGNSNDHVLSIIELAERQPKKRSIFYYWCYCFLKSKYADYR